VDQSAARVPHDRIFQVLKKHKQVENKTEGNVETIPNQFQTQAPTNIQKVIAVFVMAKAHGLFS